MHEQSRDDEPVLALHERLLAGDVTAPAEAAERFLEPLTLRLLQTPAGRRDAQIGEQAAIDAVLDYVQHPQRFRPERASLEAYLFMSAGGDLRNALRKERRHTFRAVSIDDTSADVELARSERNSSVEDQVLDGMGVELPKGLSRFEALRRIQQEFPDAADQRLLLLRFEGERHTPAYAAVLGLASLPSDQQRREVKRAKDRIEKRLQRFRHKLGIGTEVGR